MEHRAEHHVWNEKYRPQKIADCILPDSIKEAAEGYVKEGRCPTLLFSGSAGVGKTTLAKCIANELDADFLVLNASLENGIDILRTKITQFASTVSFGSGRKITLLDEADNISHAGQSGLRAFIEQFSGNHSFIMTCNFKSKLIEPLHSRCQVIDFKITNAEKPRLAGKFFKRVCHILDAEGVEYEKPVVAELVQHFFPDFRRCLNELQKYSVGGKIDSGILVDFSDDNFNGLIQSLKAKKFNDMRKWVAVNSDLDPSRLYRMFYDTATDKMELKSLPSLILMLADYQYKSAMVADQEINTAAFLTDVMLSNDIVWK